MDSFDVLIVGSGIAGLCAAVEAARAGTRVALASTGKTMSGSSFFPGTWGLGLVGPVDAADESDMVDTILAVGGGVADRKLVETFVHGIPEAIDWLENDLGITLQRPKTAESARQKQFIPCFDHKTRMWRGLTRKPLESAFKAELERLDVTLLPHHELIDLVEDESGAMCGGRFFLRNEKRIASVPAKATVIATGGTGGLFERSLTSSDVLSSAQGIAAIHGVDLVNIEFLQMMPGFVAPKRNLVFNEKTWRYVKFDGLPNKESERLNALLEQRSGYGPFTSRLPSRAIDLAIDRAGERGLAIHCGVPQTNVPEFVQTFTDWLAREHGIQPTDEMRVAIYAHASNGGIRIDNRAQTSLKGLFACGEATGGMHGADRIGGLSSANGVVFGRIAGRSAAEFAKAAEGADRVGETDMPEIGITNQTARELTTKLRHTMSTHAMIDRTDTGLSAALEIVGNLKHQMAKQSAWGAQADEIANLARLTGQLEYAERMLQAMRRRKQSLGSHYRADAEN